MLNGVQIMLQKENNIIVQAGTRYGSATFSYLLLGMDWVRMYINWEPA